MDHFNLKKITVFQKYIESKILEWKWLGAIQRQHLTDCRQNHCKPGQDKRKVLRKHIKNTLKH